MCVNAKCFPVVPIRHWGRKQQRNGESPTAPDIQYLASEMLVEVVILVFIAHSYIGITPDFGSEKRGSTPRWATNILNMRRWVLRLFMNNDDY